MLMHVPRLNRSELRKLSDEGETIDVIRARVEVARELHFARQGKFNGTLDGTEVECECKLSDVNADLFDRISATMKLSLRSLMR